MTLEKVEELSERAKNFFLESDLDNAMNCIYEALLLDQTNGELAYNLAQLLFHMKHYELSLVFMEKTLSLFAIITRVDNDIQGGSPV